MIEVPQWEKAIKTIISMCTDELMSGREPDTFFIYKLQIFATGMERDLKKALAKQEANDD